MCGDLILKPSSTRIAREPSPAATGRATVRKRMDRTHGVRKTPENFLVQRGDFAPFPRPFQLFESRRSSSGVGMRIWSRRRCVKNVMKFLKERALKEESILLG